MVGRTIRQYRITQKLGEGGMGVVYKAHDERLDRDVALKFLPRHLSGNEAEQARFLQEARAASAMNHPNVCTVYDIGEDAGEQFIVMEYVDGTVLRDAIPVADPSVAVGYGVQIAEALAEAHDRGIVHRDIKPENIMVNSRGTVKVMDFGLAKLKGSLKLTRTSSTMGTLAYMSPEQLQGTAADVRSDIFSMGVMLFELLAGSRPFRGEHEAAVMYSIANEDAPSLSSVCAKSSPQLDAILGRMLAKDPATRYQCAAAVAADLKSISGTGTVHRSVPARPSVPAPINTDRVKKEPQVTSIAVLAFEDMSAAHDQDYLCEGFAEEIINALTKIKTLRVSARTSAFAFKGKSADIREIGSKLNVQAVLEGSVRRAGNRIRITVQLVGVADGYHLWSERYDRELTDVFAIQDEITENVVRALKIVLTEGERESLAASAAPNIEAFEYYLRGRRILHRHQGVYQQAIDLFQRAIEIDPEYAAAYCGIADAYTFRYLYREATDSIIGASEAASRKALSINPDLAEARTSLGFALSARGRYTEAVIEFEKAISLDPTYYEAYYLYGRAAFAHGDKPKAGTLYREAARVRPEDTQSALLLVSVLRSLGDEQGFREAAEQALQRVERHLELNPEDARAWYGGANALIELGRFEEGEKWLERSIALDPDNAGVFYNSACAYSLLGKTDKALHWLETAIKNGFAHRTWIEQDSDFDSIRSDPRFIALLDSMPNSR